LKENGTVNEGMIPKLDNAFQAIDAGVSRVVIGKADRLSELLNGNSGTTLSNE
jgi:acetylglutamate kinase